MKDRSPLYPGRVVLIPVAGQANTYDMARADQPTEEGTPLNKATLLSDATAALYGMGPDATPDNVLAALAAKATTVTYTATVGTTWTSSGGYYYQDVAVPGILATDDPIADIDPGSDNTANLTYSKNMGKMIRITTSANSIRVWAAAAINTALPIRLKVVR